MNEEKASAYGDERLPRYTSYPTAPHFTAAVTPEVYARWLGCALAGLTVAGPVRFALSARAVLPADVLVLWLQLHRDAVGRANRGLCLPAASGD